MTNRRWFVPWAMRRGGSAGVTEMQSTRKQSAMVRRRIATASLLFPLSVSAQPGNDRVRTERSDVTRLATFVTAHDGQAITLSNAKAGRRPRPIEFLQEYGSLFGVRDAARELQRTQITTDVLGHTHTTYRQMYRGVPVFSGMLRVHQDATGGILAANGDFHPIKPGFDITPTISTALAVSIARRELSAPGADVESTTLLIVDPAWYGGASRGAALAHQVILLDLMRPLRETVFVDAHSGEIVDRWSLLCAARDRLIHDVGAGSDCCFAHDSRGCDDTTCEAIVCGVDSNCCNDDWSRTCAIRAAVRCDSLCLPGYLARVEGDGPSNEYDVDAAYDYLGDTYDYFQRAFGRDSLDGAGLPLVATVRSPAPGCPNAFWTGGRLQQMVFCPDTVTDDITAHELTHGLTERTANLIYRNQSGQLNESFSDVFGELVDLFNGDAAFADGSGPMWPAHATGPGLDGPGGLRSTCSLAEDAYPDGVRWLVAEDAVSFGGSIRDMWDPTCEGHPDSANSPLQTCPLIDGGGVHSGSGIANHGFVLAVDGGVFRGYTIAGIGPIKAGAVWYRALTTYLTPGADFRDAYLALNQSALDLVGTVPNDPRTGLPSGEPITAFDAAEVDRALLAVELDTRGRCGWTMPVLSSDTPRECAEAIVLFADDFENGVDGWTTTHTGPFGPPTPYDWVQTTSLPFFRTGTAWHCEDRDIGDCDEQNESARHSLTSPPVALPENAAFPVVAFTHYMESEAGYDGGQVLISVNERAWKVVPRSAFEFNPYNSTLRTVTTGNPLSGTPGWTGIGGRWGRSIIDLSAMARGGDTIRIRFDFGKDGCGGYGGWFVDDFVVYACPDCNRDGLRDEREFTYMSVSDWRGRIGDGAVVHFTLDTPPPAASDVLLTLSVHADLGNEDEYLTVRLNDTIVGSAFALGASDCPNMDEIETLAVPMETFNTIADGGDVTIAISASETVNANLCQPSRVAIAVRYTVDAPDDNGNNVPDTCENCQTSAAASPEAGAVPKNRYLSVAPGNRGRRTALRVTLVDLPEPFDAWENTVRWVDAPKWVSELPSRNDDTPPAFAMAGLTCAPLFLDWSAFGAVHITDAAIVPNGVYDVDVIDVACGEESIAHFSESLTVATAAWGDVVGACDGAGCDGPDGSADIATDLTAVLDAFRYAPGSPGKTRADVAGGRPDGLVDILDVLQVADAFRGSIYPFAGPADCP